MDKNLISRHISGQFNVELENIRTHALAMGGLVEQQLGDAMRALEKKDMSRAQKVSQRDHKVNAMEVAIDEACTRIIAKRQPTASDLRLVMSIVKVITDLERIGDVANSIALMVQRTDYSKPRIDVALTPLAELAVKMLHQVLDAFARMDVMAAIRLYHFDKEINQAYKVIEDSLVSCMMQHSERVPQALEMMWAARAIERVGDRCQNICEYIIYFVKGKDIRHCGSQNLEKLLDL
ncbi:Phosphate-specific transport system accessory protein PhoU [Vibrio stylophorae]|uniref:Phosphate-specific transport system accessory protein PhoU n=1 Tax=Vibrio stylophorae TaxID=659351 RepID=A0ABN8DS40_9VIBR|nr:phosphate signaling complex protein PhoU [Vibrio stylophorae]CAH0532837.1 Phosphate-specific transport system accessory protein PhoU [Vibrio stylophorae]